MTRSRFPNPRTAAFTAALGALLLTVAPPAAARTPQGAPAAQAVAPMEGVEIRRDGYGMPHVPASTPFGLFYGYGYVVAQDRLFQMEMARRSTQGRVAEVLGP